MIPRPGDISRGGHVIPGSGLSEPARVAAAPAREGVRGRPVVVLGTTSNGMMIVPPVPVPAPASAAPAPAAPVVVARRPAPPTFVTADGKVIPGQDRGRR